MLEEIEKAFNLVNFNIKSLHNLKESLSLINSGIVNLLVTIESNPSAQKTHILQADSLKDSISEYSNSCNDIKAKISDNDLILNEFLSSDRFKNIFKDIYTSIPIANSESLIYKTIPINTKEDSYVPEKNTFIVSSDDIENIYNSKILRVSEKENKVYLPYMHSEVKSYLSQFPEDYKSPEDVIKKEFVLPLDYYMKHPVLSRFRETYSLVRDREAKSIIEAIKYSMNLMFTYELNPTIIAACKTQEQLENYLTCLENNTLNCFKDFEIKFEISPI